METKDKEQGNSVNDKDLKVIEAESDICSILPTDSRFSHYLKELLHTIDET